MNLFHRKSQIEIALPDLDAALRSLSSVQPPVGLTERMQSAIERAAEELPARPTGRFGLLAFAGRTPMRVAASVAVVLAILGGITTYQWQGARRTSPIFTPVRTGIGGFGSAGAQRTPTIGAPAPVPTPAASAQKKTPLVSRGSTQPHHTVNSRAHLPLHPAQLQPISQP
jgi:hypothetical protein